MQIVTVTFPLRVVPTAVLSSRAIAQLLTELPPGSSNGAGGTAASLQTANAAKNWMNFDTSQPQNINFQTPPTLCF